MMNDEVQKDFLAETRTPERAFKNAIRSEKGLENQLQIRKQMTSGLSSQQTGIKFEAVWFIQKERNENRKNQWATEAARNHKGVTIKVSESTKNNPASNAGTFTDQFQDREAD